MTHASGGRAERAHRPFAGGWPAIHLPQVRVETAAPFLLRIKHCVCARRTRAVGHARLRLAPGLNGHFPRCDKAGKRLLAARWLCVCIQYSTMRQFNDTTNDVRNFGAGCAIRIGNFVALFAGRNHEIRAAAVRRPRTTPLDYRVGVTLGPHAALAVSRTTFSLYGINTAFGKASKINPKRGLIADTGPPSSLAAAILTTTTIAAARWRARSSAAPPG